MLPNSPAEVHNTPEPDFPYSIAASKMFEEMATLSPLPFPFPVFNSREEWQKAGSDLKDAVIDGQPFFIDLSVKNLSHMAAVRARRLGIDPKFLEAAYLASPLAGNNQVFLHLPINDFLTYYQGKFGETESIRPLVDEVAKREDEIDHRRNFPPAKDTTAHYTTTAAAAAWLARKIYPAQLPAAGISYDPALPIAIAVFGHDLEEGTNTKGGPFKENETIEYVPVRYKEAIKNYLKRFAKQTPSPKKEISQDRRNFYINYGLGFADNGQGEITAALKTIDTTLSMFMDYYLGIAPDPIYSDKLTALIGGVASAMLRSGHPLHMR